ncbi:LLM class F420-dependent oxidoreductase [Streptomyces sp. TRM68367]|uniref:LLM class F420-dependent oxidoreductase n=1 Tax=Streptomyces sp. TRM68367 TaxID=2758415 RepID=UPI00165B4841|nr:LLM class F420-dependent oxidoreductase [Streptomyces sp. TRM68367]MBC9727064.1 LLM class F420-dependent oxidoreductase [Streptomyces sp. TRM68367]
MAIRLGLSLPQARQYDIGRDVPDVARAAEQIGYESLWVYERALFPEPQTQGLYGVPGLPWPEMYRGVPEPLVTLTLAVSATERARLGTSVLVAPLHNPFQLAKSLATLDAASGGRVVVGLGTGWSVDEYAAAGVAPFEERGRVLDEILDVSRAVWGPDPVAYEGRITKIPSAVIGPKPARPIPVMLPANSKKAMTRLVDRADGWMPIAMGAGQLATQWRQVQDLAAERGRTSPVDSVVRANVQYSAKAYDGADRAAFQGNVEQIVSDLKEHADETGLPEFFLELQGTVRDAQELKDVAAELYEAARAAGI